MIALAQNDPGDILAGLGARGLQGRVLERRRADEEFLCVLKMWRAGEPEYGEEAGAEAGAELATSSAAPSFSAALVIAPLAPIEA